MTPEQQRHAEQLAFVASGAELEIGTPADCPLPLNRLMSVRGDEPWVRERFDGGLTAQVYRVHADGRDWTLKRARARCKVQNLDGQTSFLNEIQRRADLRTLKRDPSLAERLESIVDTRYASYRHGVLLSPWIDGTPIQAWSERQLLQLFDTLVSLLLGGLFEWDLCPGNTLDDGQVRLFDFGYMYRFDPLRAFNSNGTATPQFHAAERFETRQYFAHLLVLETQGEAAALAAFELEKRIAIEAYRQLRAALAKRAASGEVLHWLDSIGQQWTQGLKAGGEALYLKEAWRSHWLDLQDDLHGQTCTASTLARIDWLQATVEHRYRDLQAVAAVAPADLLLARLRKARRLAIRWQLASPRA
ncbi:protein kinase family protein [Stutzerimonas marianensis]